MKIMLISNHIKEDFDKQVKAKNDVRLMRVDNFYFFENKIEIGRASCRERVSSPV